jgi:DNA ligase-1
VASFHDFAEVCQALGQTSSRLQIADLAGTFLGGLGADEAHIAARMMVGRALEQGAENQLQISGRAIWRVVAEMTDAQDQGEDIFASATDFGEAVEMTLRLRSADPSPTLTITEVDRRFHEIAAITGRNSRGRKLTALREIFELADTLEGKYLAKILIGEMRHGMSEGLLLEAIARMASRPVAEVRRAHQLEPDVGRLVGRLRASEVRELAVLALSEAATSPSDNAAGATPAVANIAVDNAAPPKPLRPMLAAPVANVAEAFRILDGNLALEHKLDGARVQIHCDAAGVHLFSRRMNEITPSLPEVVEMMGRLGGRHAIFDGEVIAVDREGHAIAFQELMRRFGRLRDIERLRVEQPIQLFLFDVMSLDGAWLIDAPYAERYETLKELVSQAEFELARRILPGSPADGQQFYARAIAEGYEGVMAKGLDSHYTPGARGRGWLKIKTARTFDLVIVAADWGYGRRHGWLSNYHLAARDPGAGSFVEVGKTFKGLTDADFEEMTARLLTLKTAEAHGTVVVRPEVVVEVAYSDIQRSPRYAGGMALRFARVVGVRSDKSPDEADTIESVSAAFERQLIRPLASG